MTTVSVSEFKATCLALLERVRKSGQPITVTKHGKPVAKVVAIRKAEPGKDMVLIAGAGIATTFLTLGLVDELSLLVTPRLLDGGTRLFEGGYGPTSFSLVESLPFDTGAVRLTYRK